MDKTWYHCYSDNCCAYCKYHNCGMTAKQMRKKECLKKQCWHLIKNEDHPYWNQRTRIKEFRLEHKAAASAAWISV